METGRLKSYMFDVFTMFFHHLKCHISLYIPLEKKSQAFLGGGKFPHVIVGS